VFWKKKLRKKELTHHGSVGDLEQGLLNLEKLLGNGSWFGSWFY
jgi:hypothetical protein